MGLLQAPTGGLLVLGTTDNVRRRPSTVRNWKDPLGC